MEGLEFFLSPIGIVLIALLLAIAGLSMRAFSIASKQQRAVYDTLLDSAKRRTLQKFTLVVPLKKKAEALIPFMESLPVHAANKIDIVVMLYPSADDFSDVLVKEYQEKYGLHISTIRFKEGMHADVIKKHARGHVVLLSTIDTRYTARFFELLSFAGTVVPDAIAIRSFIPLGTSLGRAFYALGKVLHQQWFTTDTDAYRAYGLQPNIAVRKRLLTSEQGYLVQRMLSDELAQSQKIAVWKKPVSATAIAALVLVSAGIAALIVTTPLDLLLYITALVGFAWVLCVGLVISRAKEYSAWQKFELLLLVPFFPIVLYIYVAIQALRQGLRAIAKAHLRRRSA